MPSSDADLATSWCSRLGLDSPTSSRQLRLGQSGSLVLAVRVSGADLVLKVTQEPDRLVRAGLEADLLGSGVLGGLAPVLVAAAAGSGWTAVALTEAIQLGPASQIDRSTWTEIAVRLAGMHAIRPETVGLPAALTATSLPSEELLRPWNGLGAGEESRQGARRLADAAPAPWPPALVHGDCHVDNILRDHDRSLVWIDWQEVNLGDGLSDLVFLWQRAEFAGAQPPRSEMTVAYARARGIQPRELEPYLDTAELRLLLNSWPPFLGYGTDQGRATMLRRLVTLAKG